MTTTTANTPHPTHPPPSFPFILLFIWLSWFCCLDLVCAGTFKAKSRGDRGLKAINNRMLSEPRWRKRMQLHEQDPGLRQATVCFRSLWGPAWKGESGGVAWQTFSSSLFFFTVLSLQKEYSPPPPLPCFFYLLSDHLLLTPNTQTHTKVLSCNI